MDKYDFAARRYLSCLHVKDLPKELADRVKFAADAMLFWEVKCRDASLDEKQEKIGDEIWKEAELFIEECGIAKDGAVAGRLREFARIVDSKREKEVCEWVIDNYYPEGTCGVRLQTQCGASGEESERCKYCGRLIVRKYKTLKEHEKEVRQQNEQEV